MQARAPRILVVDDDRKDLDTTLATIRTHCASYEARIAMGAFEGLDYLFGRGRFHERGRHPLPDLVLLDVGMAPLDGVQVLKRISEADYLRKIPVALLCNTEEEKQRVGAVAKDLQIAALRHVSVVVDPLRRNARLVEAKRLRKIVLAGGGILMCALEELRLVLLEQRAGAPSPPAILRAASLRDHARDRGRGRGDRGTWRNFPCPSRSLVLGRGA